MSDRPIELSVSVVSGGLTIEVVANAGEAFSASFALEVSADSNRSLHRGTAALGRSEHAILSRISVSLALGSTWRARLDVEPSNAEPYTMEERSISPAA